MNNESNTKQEIMDFSSEYNEIVSSSEKSVIVETQWEKDGDFFQKFSMYDNSYTQVETLGNTTLIKSI